MPELLDIVGQDTALAQLQRAAGGNRRPHAYIFAGGQGVGRRTTAIEFARLLLCESPVSRPNGTRLAELPEDFQLRSACGRCRSCVTVSAGTNGDFHLVYKELARFHDDSAVRDRVMQDMGIDVIRQFLIAPAYRSASGGRGKVFVVCQAETMSIAAQNALLKTLEEPPRSVTIILICTGPARLLPTTRSRCRLVRFNPLPVEFVAKVLAAEGIDPPEGRFWAAMTGGSIGLAKDFSSRRLYEFKRQLLDALAAAPDSAGADLAGMLTKAMDKQAGKILRRDERLSKTLAARQAAQTILDIIGSAYRDALTAACGARRPMVNADQADAIDRIAAKFGPDKLADILAQLARYEQILWRNVNAKLLWDNVAITCASAATMTV